MARWRWVCVWLLGALGMALQAEPVVLTRTVLTPKEQPAVGAKVTIYHFVTNNKFEIKHLTTNAQGVFSITLEDPPPPRRTGLPGPAIEDIGSGHLVIDMPGCALYFQRFLLAGEKAADRMPMSMIYMHNPGGVAPGVVNKPIIEGNGTTIILLPNYVQRGKVVDAQNHPVVHAKVVVRSLKNGMSGSNIYINMPGFAVYTPALTAVTGADGTFTLRGVTASFNSRGGFRGLAPPSMPGGPVTAMAYA